jgi:hypothetical protein
VAVPAGHNRLRGTNQLKAAQGTYVDQMGGVELCRGT